MAWGRRCRDAGPGLMLAALLTATAPAALAQTSAATAERQQQAKVLDSLGGAYSGPQAAYVARIGETVAAAGGLAGRCTFTLVNSEVVNAFAAPPGCHIYVTRGLLSILNSEAELAGVLGHEVGHVARRHATRQRNQQVLTGLAAVLVGAVAKSDEIGQIAGQVAQLSTLGYSRSQEYEADAYSTQILPAAGYPADSILRTLAALQREDDYVGRTAGSAKPEAIPVWARTHPLTTDRIRRAGKAAGGATATPRAEPGVKDGAYLSALDGMLYGEDPTQGYVRAGAFVHPGLRIAFEAPRGFSLANGAAAVGIAGPGGLRGEFSGGGPTGGKLETFAADALRGVLGQATADVGPRQRLTVNGLETVVVSARASSQGQPVDVTVAAYAVGDSGYRFVTVAPAGQTGTFDPMFRSFRRLTDADLSRYGALRIEVVTVRKGDTSESLAARMAGSDAPLDLFRMLNDLAPGETPTPGRQVKLVVEPRR